MWLTVSSRRPAVATGGHLGRDGAQRASPPADPSWEPEGGGEELVEDPNGVSIEQCAQCLLPVGTTSGLFLLSGWGGGRVIAPLTNEQVGGGRMPPRSVPLGQGVPWGGNALAHLARSCGD